MPLAIMPGSGLPVRRVIHSMATMAPKAPAMAVFVATTANCTSVAANVDAALKPNQPNSRMNVPSRAIGMWWPGNARGLPSASELARCAAPRTRAPASRRAADGVDDTAAGEVDVSGTEAHRVPRLRQPAAAPRPRREQRVVDGAAEQAPDDEAAPLPPLGHRPGRDRGDGVHEGDHVEEQGERAGRDGTAGQRPAALPQEDPVAAAEQRAADGGALALAEVRLDVEAAERQREADEEEADEARARRWRSSC